MTPDGPVHGFESYDEFADHCSMPPEPRHMSARNIVTIIVVIAVLTLAYSVIADWLTVEIGADQDGRVIQ